MLSSSGYTAGSGRIASSSPWSSDSTIQKATSGRASRGSRRPLAACLRCLRHLRCLPPVRCGGTGGVGGEGTGGGASGGAEVAASGRAAATGGGRLLSCRAASVSQDGSSAEGGEAVGGEHPSSAVRLPSGTVLSAPWGRLAARLALVPTPGAAASALAAASATAGWPLSAPPPLAAPSATRPMQRPGGHAVDRASSRALELSSSKSGPRRGAACLLQPVCVRERCAFLLVETGDDGARRDLHAASGVCGVVGCSAGEVVR